jgi:hypothetical protein
MIGRQQRRKAALGLAAILVCALTLATPRPALAAPTNAEADTLDGVPCNSICQAYMAWSDRVMAASRPRPPAQPQGRIAARPKKPERPRARAPQAQQPASTASARLPRRRIATPRPAEIPRVRTAALSDPVTAATERRFPASEAITASLAGARTADEMPEMVAVSLPVPVSAAADPSPVNPAAGGLDLQFALSLVFAFSLCAFLVIMLLDGPKNQAAVGELVPLTRPAVTPNCTPPG